MATKIKKYRKTKIGNTINQFNVRITPEEKRYLRSLTQSINRKRKQILNMLEPSKPKSYRKRQQENVFTPKKVSANLQQFSTRRQLLQRLGALETTRLELFGTPKPIKAKEQIKATIKIAKPKIKKVTTIGGLGKQTKDYEDVSIKQWKNAKAIRYRNNMKKAIFEANLPNKNQLKILLDNMSEKGFMTFVTENPSFNISYIYNDPSNTRGQEIEHLLLEYMSLPNLY